MLGLTRVHHIAIIATDYARSKAFYCDILGFTLQFETYREARDSWKGDLALNGQYVIELFSFPFPPSGQAARKLAGCAIWRSALQIWITRWCIWNSRASPASRSASILTPISASPFLTIPMDCRWSCMRDDPVG